MPLLATVGNHFSRLLHSFIYAFPTPLNDPESDTQAPRLVDMIHEPGEPKALAGGVGPLSFAGSGYGVMLVVMALLLNRIHHIVRRPRVPRAHPTMGRYRTLLTNVITSPQMPKYLRLPGLLSLIRAWFLFSILLLQVANFWPLSDRLKSSYSGRALVKVGQWAGGMEMEKVCWQVFLSVCAGLVCSGLANGLDRTRRRDVGQGFNLFGYSFLLHLYSSPLTHHRPPPAANHGRPDVHALFQLWLSLTELTWLQAIELSSELSRNQLLPTTVCGSLGLAHFVYALTTAPLKFPSFTFLTHLMALLLTVIIVLSIVVKAFTHIFTLGYLPSPIFVNLLPHDGVVPMIEDDFGVALLKLGTACIEATQYSGLRNELASLSEGKGAWVEISAGESDVFKRSSTGGLALEITDIHAAALSDPNRESSYRNELKIFWQTCYETFRDLCWGLVVVTPGALKGMEIFKAQWERRWWYGPRSWRFWRTEAWAEPDRFALQRRVEAGKKRELKAGQDRIHRQTTPVPQIEYTYDQYLRGEVEVEDDEEDWEDNNEAESSGSASESEDDDLGLYRDLVDDQSEDSLQPVLIAHLTSNTSSPLTRRRYAAIMAPAQSPVLQDIVAGRRIATLNKERDEWDEDRKRCCVVCTTEQRDTVLWPCRCLALCNDCRESLASRLPAKDHMCP